MACQYSKQINEGGLKWDFLDKMKSSVSGVSAQQRYASNIRKINAQIQSNEKEIERLTMQVGIQCVNLHLEEPGTEYENLLL